MIDPKNRLDKKKIAASLNGIKAILDKLQTIEEVTYTLGYCYSLLKEAGCPIGSYEHELEAIIDQWANKQ